MASSSSVNACSSYKNTITVTLWQAMPQDKNTNNTLLPLCQDYQTQYPHDLACHPGLEGTLCSGPGPPAGPAAPLEVPQGVQYHLHMTHVSGSFVV